MEASILEFIKAKKATKEKLIAILLDPDKLTTKNLQRTVAKIEQIKAHLIFVGGSTIAEGITTTFVEKLKSLTQIPIILFPGETGQITDHADGILFLSLISGDNPEYLIHQQVKAAPILKESNLEVIPTGYILIDGGKETAVQKVSKTQPIPQTEVSKIIATALAGEYLGKKLLYLEAGSGATKPVNSLIIDEVRKSTNLPIIVGGGIRTQDALQKAFDSGADIVVIGTAFEDNIDFFKNFR